MKALLLFIKGGFLLITENMIENLQQIINSQLYHRGSELNILPLLKQWQKNKEYIYRELLHNNLIISFPIDIEPTKKRKTYAKKQLLQDLKRFNHKDIIAQIDVESLITNKLQNKTIINSMPFPKGIKISKIIKQLTVASPIESRLIENIYSSFVNTFKIKGDLCISIDPIDFITMSDNDYSWTSCHSLEDGEYRSGLLSLLVDSTTLVCYLKGKEPFDFFGVETTNKKWRMLIHYNQKYILYNTQYPFKNKYIVEELTKHLINLLSKGDNQTSYEIIKTNMEHIIPFINDNEENLHYNDLLASKPDGEYKNASCFLIKKEIECVDSEIQIGESPLCPVCGEGYLTDPCRIECSKCNPTEYCCKCGGGHDSDELHDVDDELYCDICLDNEFIYCDKCDELIREIYYEEHVCGQEIAL